MIELAWLIPLFGLAAFLILVFFGRYLREGSAWLGILFSLGAFVFAVLTLLERIGVESTDPVVVDWLAVGDHLLTVGYHITPLNALMLFIVTLVSLVVHIYARGYMQGDDRISVFYAYLALFTFSMLALVMSPNLLQLYIFWELVGVCSFLLVGFYFYKPEARAAAKKAFVMTRIGDVGLFIAIILLFWQVGSFDISAIFQALDNNELSGGMITLTAILVFVGAVGKSGQFPLHTWLPDAMEGPTPVSALIHAATMVAAGVYLVAAMFPLFEASLAAMNVVAYVGAFTAIFAASIALVQNDIKRVLAYSTVSQLGFMMLALGAAGYVAGVFHLMTHAFFKALLFLAAGSVIHAVHTQNIQHMGGLFGRMKITGTLFFIACLAIAGIPPFAGFFSKEEILLTVWQDGHAFLFFVALAAALLTAFYMFRLFFLVFVRSPRATDQATEMEPVRESPPIMTVPMIILGLFTVVGGFVHTHWFGTYLGEWLVTGPAPSYGFLPEGATWILLLALLVSIAGIVLAYARYVNRPPLTEQGFAEKSWAYRTLENKYYVDEAYDTVFVRGLNGLGRLLVLFDRYIVGGVVSLVRRITDGVAAVGARLQNGQVQTYGVTMVFGLAVLIILYMLTGGVAG